MDDELKKRIDHFIEDFMAQKEIKQYLLLKEEIIKSEEIKEINQRLVASKKQLAKSFGTANYQKNKDDYLKIQSEYDQHPLIVNYNVAKDVVTEILEEISGYLDINKL